MWLNHRAFASYIQGPGLRPQITKEKKNVNDTCFYVIQLRH